MNCHTSHNITISRSFAGKYNLKTCENQLMGLEDGALTTLKTWKINFKSNETWQEITINFRPMLD